MIRRFLALVGFLICCVGHANAQSIPPSYVQQDALQGYRCSGNQTFPTASEACDWTYNNEPKSSGYTWTKNFTGTSCQILRNGSQWVGYSCVPVQYCADGSMPSYGKCNVPTCPTDYRLENGMCVPDLCPLGYDRDASGQCVKDCTAKRGMALPNTHYRVGESGNGALGGCKFNCDTRVKFAIAVFGDPDNEPQPEWISTGCRYTGQPGDEGDYNAEGTGTDVPPPDKPTKPDDCLGQGLGYIQSSSGQTNCVPGSAAPPGQRPDEVRHDRDKESGKPGSDGKPDPNAPDYKKESERATRKDGDIIINKEEKIRQPGYDQGTPQPCPEGYTSDGSGYCVKSESQRQKESDYCRENPNTPICDIINKGTDSADKPDGPNGTCKAGDKSAACAKLDDVPDGDIIPEESAGVSSIATVAVASNASCPQGPTLPFGIGYFPMDGLCMYASGLRPIIIALAWLSAGLIVFGAIRE